MSFIVKITTKINILDLVCPHRCKKCGRLGSLLCDRCKKYIINNAKGSYRFTKNLPKEQVKHFKLFFQEGWACGWRDDVIGQLVQDYKFHSMRAATPILAQVLDQVLPDLPKNVILVPLPTSPKHIRERGFDHTKKIAKYLAAYRGWGHQNIFRRVHSKVQVGASLKQRYQQAEGAYQISKPIDKNKTYILLDDIWTTGASMCAVGKLLHEAGVKKIYATTVAISR